MSNNDITVIKRENGSDDKSGDNKNVDKWLSPVLKQATDGNSSKWKEALSGALDNEHIIGAMIILTIFYLGNTIRNAIHDSNTKDEDKVTKECSCRSEDRAFYLAWYIVCSSLWLLCHILVQVHKYWPCRLLLRCFKCCGSVLVVAPCFGCIVYIPTSCIKYIAFKLKSLQEQYCKCGSRTNTYGVSVNNTTAQTNDATQNVATQSVQSQSYFSKIGKRLKYTKDNVYSTYSIIKRYWQAPGHRCILQRQHYVCAQYYELYVIGITKSIHDQTFNEQKIQEIFDKLHYKDETDLPEQQKNQKTLDTKMPPPNITTVKKEHTTRNIQYCCQCFIHLILLMFQLIAQLAVVPLLLIKVFDTYSYLCFTNDRYCTMREEYSLHLHKTAMTFAFYCGLTLSFLTSTMLNWIPWPTFQPLEEASSPHKNDNDDSLPSKSNGTPLPKEKENTPPSEFLISNAIDIPPATDASSDQFYTPIEVNLEPEHPNQSTPPVPQFPVVALPYGSTFTSRTDHNV